ncbi:MarR family transcriptional regulator [Sphingomonas koreensis]|nr:MarR family transcriptional regulator [Sphingomonas koreensis]
MPSAIDRDSSEALIVRAVLRLARRLRIEAPSGALGGGALGLLNTLHRAGPMPAVDLAEAEGLAPQSLSRLLARLDESGMIARTADPDDRRHKIITLTALGRQALGQAMRERRAWIAAALAKRLDDDERATLIEAAALMLRLAI